MKKIVTDFVLFHRGSTSYSGKIATMYIRQPENWNDVTPFIDFVKSKFGSLPFILKPKI